MNMRWRPPAGMRQVLDLVKSGRLSEATALIRAGADGIRAEWTAPEKAAPDRAAPKRAASKVAAKTAPRPAPKVAPKAAPSGPAKPRTQGRRPVDGLSRDSFACAAGRRDYALALPDGRPRGLVVMLHGCTQDADDFARGTGMSAAAGPLGFAVLYPEQARAANPMGCWNWFDPGHQAAAAGEPAILAAMIDDIARQHGVPPGAVAVAGLSAGGAMAAVLGDTHPQLFSTVAIHSGLPSGAARSMGEAFAAMKSGSAAAPGPFRVPTLVFHGQSDTTVAPANGETLAGGVGRGPRETGEAGGRRFTREQGPHGEVWRIDGLGHAWSGGSAAGSYTDPAGPDASAVILRFFGDQLRRRGRTRG